MPVVWNYNAYIFLREWDLDAFVFIKCLFVIIEALQIKAKFNDQLISRAHKLIGQS